MDFYYRIKLIPVEQLWCAFCVSIYFKGLRIQIGEEITAAQIKILFVSS